MPCSSHKPFIQNPQLQLKKFYFKLYQEITKIQSIPNCSTKFNEALSEGDKIYSKIIYDCNKAKHDSREGKNGLLDKPCFLGKRCHLTFEQ